MSDAMARHAVKVLVENYGRNFPKDGMKSIWAELVAQPDRAIELAVDNIVLNNNYLPTPAQLLEKVKLESRKIAADESRKREREWAEQKGGETPEQIRRNGSIFTSKQSDEHAKQAVQALMLMFNTEVSREDKLEAFRVMEHDYPGVGWGKAGGDLKRWWEEGIMWKS